MCNETPGVPPLLPAHERGASDRIPPAELQHIGGRSYAHTGLPAQDRSTGAPILVVCHERYGVVRHTVELADRFAAAGFVAVAPDFYADAGLTGEEERLPHVPDDVVLVHLDRAIEHARTLPGASPASAVAVIGICRSGSYGVLASAARSDIAAVVMLYGGAQQREYETGRHRPTPYVDMLRAGRAPVLGLWGERDHTMSVEDVRQVRGHLEDARRSYDFTIYRDMPHGWLNDTMPGRFRADAADAAFRQMADWLHATCRTDRPAAQDVAWAFRSTIAHDYDFTQNERLH